MSTLVARIDHLPAISAARSLAWIAALALSGLLAGLLAETGPFLTAALLAGILVILVIVKYPWVGVLLLVASVPAQEFGALSLGGQTMTITRAMLPLAILGYVLSLIVHRQPVRGTPALIPYVLFVGLIAVSATWASSISTALAESSRWLIALGSFIVLVHFLSHSSQRRIFVFVGVMAAAGVFQATYGVTQSIFAIGPESFRVGTMGSRAFGTFGQPNSYAGYMEMVFFPVFWMAMYVATRLPSRVKRLILARRAGFASSATARRELAVNLVLLAIFGGSALLILGGIVASYSRGAWLGVAAGVAVTMLIFHSWVRRAMLLAIPLALLVAIGGAPSVLPAAVSERVTTGFADLRPFDAASIPITDENFAAAERMAHWQAGWRMFAEQPLTGVGAGNFNVEYGDYFVREQFQFSRGHAHNFYIHVLAETGLPGLALYLWLVITVLILALRTIISAPAGFNRMLAIGAFGTIVSVSVHNFFENLHVLNLSIQLGAVWALAIAAHRSAGRSPNATPVSE